MPAVRACAPSHNVGRYDQHGGQVPTTLFEAAAFHHTIKARCPSCEHVAIFHAAALWWLFQRKHWSDHFDYAGERMKCTGCGRRGIRIVAVRESPTVTHLPLPGDHEWKRAVSRFRS
ncbi:hypothetical protein [Sphingomonas immobilis]|uniref:Zinc-ribbon domain-containing protein n=1 Tax=Sphingomonas immobilis TaxID=3063997 RepID=A0ABT9A3K6_9SPHN|nr:hypothetical protein [Sphingomonas sp. CA1-15]MDO7843561.1 hypothetical protein [Sphingomonas sp. CA1-15]